MVLKDEGNTRKRFKTKELDATYNTKPGLKQGTTLIHKQRKQRLNTKFDVIILSEAVNKKTSRTNVKELTSIREEYNEIFELMLQENCILEGRLLEARAEKNVK